MSKKQAADCTSRPEIPARWQKPFASSRKIPRKPRPWVKRADNCAKLTITRIALVANYTAFSNHCRRKVLRLPASTAANAPLSQSSLMQQIFDFGMYDGSDTQYYL